MQELMISYEYQEKLFKTVSQPKGPAPKEVSKRYL
jgi:hypothetical protein